MVWLRNLKLTRKLFISFLLFFGFMLVLGLYALDRLAAIDGHIKQIQGNWMPSAVSLQQMKSELLDYRLAELQHVLSADDASQALYREAMDHRLARFKQNEETYARLISAPEEESLYREFRRSLDKYLAASAKLIELSRQHRQQEATDWLRDHSYQLKEDLGAALDKLVRINQEGALAAGRSSAATVAAARRNTLLVVGLAALAELLAGLYLGRVFAATVARLQRAGVHTRTSATGLSAAIRQQEATVTGQAASTAEIAASVREISATAGDLSGAMDEIDRVAEETNRRAAASQQDLARLDQTMQRMVEACSAVAAKLAVLDEKAGNITAVVTTIDKVADQINLLSLNAAIEAEKAGESGLGFAVVATEIRRLADRTAVATYDIEQTLKEMQSAVSASVMGMDRFSEEIRRNVEGVRQIGGQLGEVVQRIQALAPRFDAVYRGMQAQTQGTGQITQAMNQFNEGMQQTVEAIHCSQRSVDLLAQAVEDVQDVVQRF